MAKKKRSAQKKQRNTVSKNNNSPPKQTNNSNKSNSLEKRKRTADDACLDRDNENNTINNFKKRRLYSRQSTNNDENSSNNSNDNVNSTTVRKPLSPKQTNTQTNVDYILKTNKLLQQENEKLKLENLTLKLENDKLLKTKNPIPNSNSSNNPRKFTRRRRGPQDGTSSGGNEEEDFENFLNDDEEERQQEIIAGKRQLNHVSDIKQNGKAFLYCRIRPLIDSELAEKQTMDHISWTPDLTDITITKHGGVLSGGKNIVRDYSFGFDKVFPPSFKQTDVFKGIQMEKYVLKACRGGNVSLFCIGNTGSGKTYTIEGAKKTRPATTKQAPSMTPLKPETHSKRKIQEASSSADSEEENDMDDEHENDVNDSD